MSKSCALAASGVAEFDAVEKFHRQHAAGRQLGESGRNAHFGMIGQIAGKTLDVTPLAGKIELAAQRPLEFGHDRPRAVIDEFGNALGEHGQSGQDFQIDPHPLFDAGMLHFDGHLPPE